ncbi:ABC transporter permease [Ruminococcus sp.]|uniref:ABC transporter permease n=1 Tax=Ruminococcus sp. TaxID=41978 RepID=UPI0025FE3B44|nr:ABC transporter permease [Ruminococcus sp.]MCR4639214.1 ABC transporter permease [Ruminococcus sp.]
MKTINKRVFRGIFKDLSFYISSILLTSIAVLLFLAELSAGDTVEKNYIGFMERNNVESAEFSVMQPLSDEDIERLSEKYDLLIEKQEYIDCCEDDFTLRIFKPTENINKYEVLEGEDVSDDDQIMLSKGFMEANNFKIGDMLSLGGKEFNISGAAQRPDYLYMLHNESDIYRSNAAFGMAVMTDEGVESLGKTAVFYSVIYNNNSKEATEFFRRELNDEFTTLSYTSAENYSRIHKVGEVRDTCTVTGYSIIAVMSLLVIAVVSLILGRIVRRDGKHIGTLSAFGISSSEIKNHYMLYGIIPGILGSIAGILMTVAVVKPLVKYSISNIEYLEGSVKINSTALVLSIIIPALSYALTARRAASKLLKRYRTTELLSGRTEGSKKRRSQVLENSDITIRRKFKIRTIFTSKKRTMIAVIGMFCGALFILFGYTMTDSVHQSFIHGFDDMGKYNYQYVLSKTESGTPDVGGEAMVIGSFEEADNGTIINIYGAENDTELVNVNVNGKSFDPEKFYATSIASIVYGIKEGDQIEVRNPLSLEKQTIEISGIIDNAVVTGIFTGRENACSFMGIEDESFYNAIVSEKAIANEDELQIYTKIEKNALGGQLEEAATALNVLLYMFFVIGIIVCVAFIYICVNQVVTENQLSISMFKVLGYKNREINSMVLNSYGIFVPLVFAVAIPATLRITQRMLDRYAALYHFEGHAKIELISIVISALIFLLSYAVSMIVLRKKVLNADMVEVMKDHRE